MTKSISVCMSVFGKSKYLSSQLESIINQTVKIDELIVVEDFSGKESPKKLIQETCSLKNIKLVYFKLRRNAGPHESFRLAISNSNGDIIFLADHDDIWSLDRVEKVIPYHDKSILVLSNGLFYEKNKPEKRIYKNLEFNIFKVIERNKFIGATFSIEGNFARNLSKFLSFYPMHDWVIYLASLLLKKNIHLTDEDLFFYRRHSETYTGRKKNGLIRKLQYRLFIIKNLFVILLSANKLNKS